VCLQGAGSLVSDELPVPVGATIAILADLLEEACGIFYGPADRPILASKIEAHVRELGHGSLLDYYYGLRYDDPGGSELARLVEATLVHESYFFRELAPLAQLVDGHLTHVVQTRGHARVWSAACSTGEEPFTLAMLLEERGLLDRVEIVASDISATAIARAKTGRHPRRALRDGHPGDLAARYLERGGSGIAIAPHLREAVQFHTINLLDDGAVRRIGTFDAILCRNVLIYFREERIASVLDRLTRRLAPSGVIAVGISESLLRFGSLLVCEERGRSFFYRGAP
jgi:chemotaxis protein methyltransferase CheR